MDLWGISHVSIFSVINRLRLFLLSLFRGAQVIMCLSSRGCSFLNTHGAGCAAACAQRHVLAQTCLPLKKEDECDSYHVHLVTPQQPPALQRSFFFFFFSHKIVSSREGLVAAAKSVTVSRSLIRSIKKHQVILLYNV